MSVLTPEQLGFSAIAGTERAWTASARGKTVELRELHALDEMGPLDELQRAAIAASDYDLIPANEMVVVRETGGHVIAASIDGALVGGGYAWGGFAHGKPRLVSDFFGVLPAAQSHGIGELMKRLQAAIAWRDGFEEIVWTVDPLRAANARLNFGKLGATAQQYERNRYGKDFAPSHYGGLPTDRLHLSWAIREQRVIDRLLGREVAPEPGDTRLVAIPTNIDSLIATSPEEALRRRLEVREQLESLFADGWRIDGFAPAASGADPHLVLHRAGDAR